MLNTVAHRRTTKQENALTFTTKNRAYIQAYLNQQIERFNSALEDIEKRCSDLQESPDAILQAVTNAFNDLAYACEEFERQLAHDKAAIIDAQVELREKTNALLLKSYFITRARTWPQGYPGDYKTLEDVYRNTPLSNGLGYYLDRYFLATELGVGVRERLATLTGLLKGELLNRTNPKVLNVACGSCRELVEVAPEVKQSGAQVTCIDFDPDALTFSANRLSYTGIEDDQLVFRKYNAFKMISPERNLKEFGMQDIVYSTGFYDYVEDDVLVRLLKSSYQLLNPGGTLIASFKDCRRYRTTDYHWFADWHGFLQRTEEEMWTLFDKAEIPRSALRTLRTKSEVINFFVATK